MPQPAALWPTNSFLEPLTSSQLKLQLHAIAHQTTDYAGHVAVTCIVDSLRRGCCVPPSTLLVQWCMIASQEQLFLQEIEVETYPCIYNWTLYHS